MAGGKAGTLFGRYPRIGFLSIFYSIMDSPLAIWEKQERQGEIRRGIDEDKHAALELYTRGNIYLTYITAPCFPFTSLGIKLPFAVFIIKNLQRPFAFTIQIKDEICKRRLMFSNTHRTSRVKNLYAHIPISLDKGWNELPIDLAAITQKAFGTTYKETARVQIHASCRLRMIYFSAAPLETRKAAEILRGILSNLSGPESFESDLEDSNSKESVGACLRKLPPLLVPVSVTKSLSSTRHSRAQDCIRKSLAWRERLAAFNVKNAVALAHDSDEVSDAEASPKVTKSKSCPEFTTEMDAEQQMRSLIEEELLAFDFEKLIESEKYMDESNENYLMSDSDCNSSIQAFEGVTENENPEECDLLEDFELDSSEEIQQHDEENSPESVQVKTTLSTTNIELSQNVCVYHSEEEISDIYFPNPKISFPGLRSRDSMKEFDEQLVELETIVNGIMRRHAFFQSTLLSRTTVATPRISDSPLKMNEVKEKIEELKLKLSKLEASVDESEVESQFPISEENKTPLRIMSTPFLMRESHTFTPSGILRLPGTRSSIGRLNRKLNVRFSPILEEEEPEDNQPTTIVQTQSTPSSPTASFSLLVNSFSLPSYLQRARST